jgi:hypothetical protein
MRLVRGALVFLLATTPACDPAPRAAVSPAPSRSSSPALDPVAAVVDRVTREAYAKDLAELAHPRHHRSAPEGLAQAERSVAASLAASGFRVSTQQVLYDGSTARNVVAERGPEGGEVVIVCAHYDAVPGTDGADDDASGAAGVLAVARALGDARLERRVRAILFAFEEEGLVGSRAYVASLSDDERRSIRGVINLEMIGYVAHGRGSQRYPEELAALVPRALLPAEGDFLGILGSDDPGGPMEALERAKAYVPRLRAVLLPSSTTLLKTIPDLRRSDHAPFWEAGVPAVIAGDTADFRTPHYHQPSDRIATLDLEFATDSARLAAAATAILAGAR